MTQDEKEKIFYNMYDAVLREDNISLKKYIEECNDVDITTWEEQTVLFKIVLCYAEHISPTKIKMLVDNNADFDFSNKYGVNILHLISSTDNTDAAKYILSLDMDINKRTKGGFTPILCAYSNENMKMMNLLIKSGADKRDIEAIEPHIHKFKMDLIYAHLEKKGFQQ